MILSSIIYHILYLIIYCAKTPVMVKEFVRGLFFHGVNWLPWHECGCRAQGEKGKIKVKKAKFLMGQTGCYATGRKG